LGVVVAAFSHLKIYTFPNPGIPVHGGSQGEAHRAAIVDVDGVEILLPREFFYEVNIHQDVAHFGDLIPRGAIPGNPRTGISLGWSVYGFDAGTTFREEHVDEEPTS
jgi:hypothetical protein